jgi:cytochrome c-type biogenesis protein
MPVEIRNGGKNTRSIRALKIFSLLLIFTFLLSFSSIGDEPTIADNPKAIYAVPDGYVHRPIAEFFTGLSCPSCMNGPHQDMDKLWEANLEKPEEPFTFVVFHELNGGGVDDLATEESRDRMRHYQPGVSGTPDVQFDGGYIRLGGIDTSDPITESNAAQAVADCQVRYERQFDPFNPRQFLRNEFKFVELFVNQVFTGDGYAVSVSARYLGMDTIILSDPLSASLYVFMIEDNVTAYSTVLEENVQNHNVFRGYAIEDEQFTLGPDEVYETTVVWDIPEAQVPIKPGDLTAVAAIYDMDDTDSQHQNQGNNVNVPRAIQSATPKSTAYDQGNDLPVVEDLVIDYDGDAQITAQFEDENGISMAYVLYNTEAANATTWEYVEMEISGEELCDDSGACYAYLDSQGVATIPMGAGDTLYYQLLIYDGNATEGKTQLATYKAEGGSQVAIGASLSFGVILIVLGIIVLGGVFLYILMDIRKRNVVDVEPLSESAETQTPFEGRTIGTKRPSKAMMMGAIVLGALLISVGAVAAVLPTSGEEVPDIAMTDVDGNDFSLSDFRGKVVFLEFMATWCSDCQKLTKQMKEVHSYFGDSIVMISLDIDQKESPQMLKKYADDNGAKWIFAFPKNFNTVHTTFSIHEIPKSLIIDKDGYLTFEFVLSQPASDIISKIEATKQGAADPISSYSVPLVLLAFAAGIASFFSPCSFPMLPGYVGYYFSLEEEEQRSKKEVIKKALPLGIAAALGILLVYLFIGGLVMAIGSPILPFIPILAPIVAVVVIVLGILMLTNIQYYRITNTINNVSGRVLSIFKFRDNTMSSFFNQRETGTNFVYGMGYGLAAAGCTLPIFLLIITGALSTGGFLSGMFIFLIYGIGMGIFMVVVTLLVATSKDTIINKMKMSTHRIKVVSGVVMIIAGIALLLGFYAAFLV